MTPFKATHKKPCAHYITVEGCELPIIIAKNRRAKRLIIRYDNKQEAVKLTLPRFVSERSGLAFVESKQAWIAAQRKVVRSKTPFANGARIPLCGKEYILKHIGGRGLARIENDEIHISGAEEFMPRRVRDFIKKHTLEEITRLVALTTPILQKAPSGIALRETTSRWGSCSTSGQLSFCWRLAFAPHSVLNYVVCHELAHLIHHNHSKAYWTLLAQLCSHVDASEAWLKVNGQSLWNFD